MVTVETAFAMLVWALAVAAALLVAGAAFLLGQCQVVANEVARQTARGDAAAVRRAIEDAPTGATVATRTQSGAVLVEVTWRSPLGPDTWALTASARVLEET